MLSLCEFDTSKMLNWKN